MDAQLISESCCHGDQIEGGRLLRQAPWRTNKEGRKRMRLDGLW